MFDFGILSFLMSLAMLFAAVIFFILMIMIVMRLGDICRFLKVKDPAAWDIAQSAGNIPAKRQSSLHEK